jgi:hypothetical protein
VTTLLGGGPHHGWPADVDQLDRRVRREGIQVTDDEFEGDDVVLVQRRTMFGFVEIGQDRAVDPRVQRLHATVQHLRKTSHVLDVDVFDTGIGQSLRRTTRSDQINT